MFLFSPSDLTNIPSTLGPRFFLAGTAATPAPASTSSYTATLHNTFTAATGASSMAGFRPQNTGNGNNSLWRGNAAGVGGFFVKIRWGIDTWTAGDSIFVGLSNIDSMTNDTVGPGSKAYHGIGLATDCGDAGVIKLFTNSGASNTKTTITNMPTAASGGVVWLDFYLYAPPNGSSIFYRVDDLTITTSGACTSGRVWNTTQGVCTLVDTSIATTLPGSTTFIGPTMLMGTGANAGAAAAVLSIARVWAQQASLQ